jgi:hypothetical protein
LAGTQQIQTKTKEQREHPSFLSTGGKNLFTANDSSVSASPELDEAPASPSFPHYEETIRKEGRIASSSQAISVVLQDRTRAQQVSKEMQASPLKNDGGL